MRSVSDLLSRIDSPSGYKKLARIHKYWGKKPREAFALPIELFTDPGDIVVDPMMGYGLVSLESFERNRRFIGNDLNPTAYYIGDLLTDLPELRYVEAAFEKLRTAVKPRIEESYVLPTRQLSLIPGTQGAIATHYLWDKDEFVEIWRTKRGKKREVFQPTGHDMELAMRYENYETRHLRTGRFFQNSRINSKSSFSLRDIFTGRALRNIDLLLGTIRSLPQSAKRCMELALTAASGQMSRMVFAVTRRGKTTNEASHSNSKQKIEVGSWTVGYWRPDLHFEVNVWHCFENRVKRFLSALRKTKEAPHPSKGKIEQILKGDADVSLHNTDASEFLAKIEKRTCSLVITDPPHGDRIPYLELSEMWNAILGEQVDWGNEVVISDAEDRGMGKEQYTSKMVRMLSESSRILRDDGVLVVMFNARQGDSWDFLTPDKALPPSLSFVGSLPLQYSAGSVLQDNRSGSLENDYLLIYVKNGGDTRWVKELDEFPGWSEEIPSPQ